MKTALLSLLLVLASCAHLKPQRPLTEEERAALAVSMQALSRSMVNISTLIQQPTYCH